MYVYIYSGTSLNRTPRDRWKVFKRFNRLSDKIYKENIDDGASKCIRFNH